MKKSTLKMIAGVTCIFASVIAYLYNFPYYGWILVAGILSILTIEE